MFLFLTFLSIRLEILIIVKRIIAHNPETMVITAIILSPSNKLSKFSFVMLKAIKARAIIDKI